MSTLPNTRQAALETLFRCRKDGAWTSAVLDEMTGRYGFDRRDAAFTTCLVLSVLENTNYCDFYIDSFCRAKLEPKVRDILRLGTAQLLILDRIPVRAAVNETVSLCKQNGCTRASGLVNAVLRRIADNRESLPEIPGKGSAEYLSVRYSHPLWLAEELVSRKGYAFTEAFFAENNKAALLSLQINTCKVSTDDYTRALIRSGIAFHSPESPAGCLLLEGGVVQDLPGFEEGLFYIQDRAARLSVDFVLPEPGMRVLDACACPGGKSFAAAIHMKNRGSILSCDIHEKKLSLLRAGADRLGIDIIQTRQMDAREFDPDLKDRFDLVIADVPCSGTGVIRKRPEIRCKEHDSIKNLPIIQSAILENVSHYVAPGGLLLYSTCSILREENEEIVSAFLSHHADFRTEAIQTSSWHITDGMYTFWPHTDSSDGFFAAVLRKKQ